ncbi:Dynein-1-alpha heavy chain, flagellar inner arm I1 complex [Tetrabaena socialis]|uniref:Dynein-1-alpha heavy chain, flagellar inner arm I1 complex n=1 Tax=Tetrabaena socialis TaxID=47790 RepID=A0A2J8ADR4_9CHLO|nr:Dynein-1-alpha heavy chain, flagellar inner arm I1 complex [Tetrabaena socialis]|eukprot:PNH10671.1 Dynein-1-alpha heavy chain, flagellar inner arm I1 complex [Tetrabaena socialis]
MDHSHRQHRPTDYLAPLEVEGVDVASSPGRARAPRPDGANAKRRTSRPGGKPKDVFTYEPDKAGARAYSSPGSLASRPSNPSRLLRPASPRPQNMVDERGKRFEGERRPPLFKVTVSLQSVDVVVQPPMTEVNKALGRLVRSLVESTKAFVRWMDGTCIETPEQRGATDDDEPIVFTFYWDVAANPQVIKTMLQLNQSIQKAISSVNKYAESWRRHQSLWKTDKNSVLDKFKARDPAAAAFEEKLSKYSQMATEVSDQARDFDQDFIRVSCHALASSVCDEALGWVRSIAQTMRELDATTEAALRDKIAKYQTALHRPPSTLEELKQVLNTVNQIRCESVPVRKVSYNPVADGLSYQPDKCPGCTLFGGTVVAQARASRSQKAIAVVCRTRFYSAKGQLLRSILFPREHEESFVSDSLRFIAVMLAACLGLYVWAAVVLTQIGATPSRIVVRFFDMITIAVPPALPACLTIATVFSIGRLRKKGIYVTSPDRITLAGQLDVICFDKTAILETGYPRSPPRAVSFPTLTELQR